MTTRWSPTSRLNTKHTTARRRRASCWRAAFGAWRDISITSLSFFLPSLGGGRPLLRNQIFFLQLKGLLVLEVRMTPRLSLTNLFSVSPRLAMEFCLLRTSASYWSYLSTGLDPGIQLIQSIRFQGFPRWREMLWEIRGWMEDLLWAGWTKLNKLKTWLNAKSKTLPGSLSDDTGPILRLKGCIWVEKLLLLQRTPLRNKQILTNLTETVADYKMWT